MNRRHFLTRLAAVPVALALPHTTPQRKIRIRVSSVSTLRQDMKMASILGGRAYVVGEKGPELIVPNDPPGVVLPS